MKSWWLAGLAALTLGSAANAQDVAAPPAVFNTLNACVAGVVPAGQPCQVIGTANMHRADGSPVNWALYEIGSGEARSGLSVLMTDDATGPRVAAAAPIPTSALDQWKRQPYVMASILKRDDGEYAVMMAPGDERPAAFSVHRIEASGWTPVDASGLWPAIGQRLTTISAPGCYPISTDISWRAFALRIGMMSDDGACGAAVLSLGVENGAVTITDALTVKSDLTPERRRRVRRR